MARPSSSRITRKNIRQPDQFLIFAGQVLDFVKEHKTLCLAALTGLILLGVATAGWSLYRDRQDQLAATDFNKALVLFRTGKFSDAASGFATAHTHASSALSGYALLYQANSQLQMRETDGATKTLQKLIAQERKPTLLRQIALLTLGYAFENAGKWKEAADTYAQAEAIDGPYQEDALLSKARCAAEGKDYKAATEAYNAYLKAHPNSPHSGEVSLRLQKLSGIAASGK